MGFPKHKTVLTVARWGGVGIPACSSWVSQVVGCTPLDRRVAFVVFGDLEATLW